MKPISWLDRLGLRRTEQHSESEETRRLRVEEAADDSGVLWLVSGRRLHEPRGETSPRDTLPPQSRVSSAEEEMEQEQELCDFKLSDRQRTGSVDRVSCGVPRTPFLRKHRSIASEMKRMGSDCGGMGWDFRCRSMAIELFLSDLEQEGGEMLKIPMDWGTPHKKFGPVNPEP